MVEIKGSKTWKQNLRLSYTFRFLLDITKALSMVVVNSTVFSKHHLCSLATVWWRWMVNSFPLIHQVPSVFEFRFSYGDIFCYCIQIKIQILMWNFIMITAIWTIYELPLHKFCNLHIQRQLKCCIFSNLFLIVFFRKPTCTLPLEKTHIMWSYRFSIFFIFQGKHHLIRSAVREKKRLKKD